MEQARSFKDLLSQANELLGGSILVTLFSILLLVFFVGMVRYMYAVSKGDPEEMEDGKQLMVWGLLALLAAVAVWGIVKLILVTLTGGISASPPRPRVFIR